MRARLRGGGGARRAREQRWRPEARARARSARHTRAPGARAAPRTRHAVQALVQRQAQRVVLGVRRAQLFGHLPARVLQKARAAGAGRSRGAGVAAPARRVRRERGAGTRAAPAPSAPALATTHRHRARRLHEQRLHRVVQQVDLRAEIRERGAGQAVAGEREEKVRGGRRKKTPRDAAPRRPQAPAAADRRSSCERTFRTTLPPSVCGPACRRNRGEG